MKDEENMNWTSWFIDCELAAALVTEWCNDFARIANTILQLLFVSGFLVSKDSNI